MECILPSHRPGSASWLTEYGIAKDSNPYNWYILVLTFLTCTLSDVTDVTVWQIITPTLTLEF